MMSSYSYSLYVLVFFYNLKFFVYCNSTTIEPELNCEYPPALEEDLTTHVRRKRLTTKTGVACIEDYPYTVSIRINKKHWCGGAIVDKQWVLTAAQCFDYVTEDEVTVRVGSVFRDYGGSLMSVINITRHPVYNMEQYYPEHNLAMVKLNIPITENERTGPVAIALADADLPLPGQTVVTGYGSMKTGQIREGVNQELRRMIVRERPRARCRLMYGNDYRLQHDNICLQSVEKGISLCTGDMGDPAVHFDGSNGGTLYGIAIFSGTEECSCKSKPGIYAKVSYSRVWIDEVMTPIPGEQTTEDGQNATVPSDSGWVPITR